MTVERATGYLQGILMGLKYLHDKGIVHRDIKVANVLISRGVCKLTDFGTAAKLPSRAAQEAREKRKGAADKDKVEDSEEANAFFDTAGTPAYMAPEVLRSEGHDWRADIWSMGCLVMEMLTGKTPFKHVGEVFGVMKYISDLTPKSILNIGPYQYHPLAREFIFDCMHVDPDRRKNCAALLESDLMVQLNDDVARKQSVVGVAKETRKMSMAQGAQKRRRQRKGPRQCPGPEMSADDDLLALMAEEDSGRFDRRKSYATGVAPRPSNENEGDDWRRGTNFSGWGSENGDSVGGREKSERSILGRSDKNRSPSAGGADTKSESTVSSGWGT